MPEKIYGSINNVTYYNEDNGYGVVKVTLDYSDNRIAKFKSKLFSNVLVVTGNFLAKPLEKEEYDFTGDFVQTKYGIQFKARTYKKREPKSLEGVVSFLSSDFFPGIGKVTAKKVYQKLGSNCIEMIVKDRAILDQVKITEKQKEVIFENLVIQKKSSDDLLFLLDLGISMHFALKIQRILKEKAAIIIRENPYRLIDLVDGINFIRADRIALNLGIDPTGTVRIKAMIIYYLRNQTSQAGDCYIELYDLKEFIYEHLRKGDFDLSEQTISSALEELKIEKKIVIEEDILVYDAIVYKAEKNTARYIYEFIHTERNDSYEQDKVLETINKIANQEGIQYAKKQLDAISKALLEPFVIITGGPGTGKSTIIKGIIESLCILESEEYRTSIALLAPTGRAAKRLKEITNHPAQTIHKFLGFEGHGIFKYGPEEQVYAKVVIVDEVSMVDIILMARLLGAIPKEAKIILVGDRDQLPSVGPGQVLSDIIRSKELTSIELDQIHRQAENSTIVDLAHAVNQGYLPETILEKTNDRNFISMHDVQIANNIARVIKQGIDSGMDIVKDIQVLLPLYKGDVGLNYINFQLQEKFNPNVAESQITHLGRHFRVNDKVIQLVNRSEKQIMNGDIGYILELDKQGDKFIGLFVMFDVGSIYYAMNELEDLAHAYAISIHKAQGSEFDLVVLPFSFKHYVMLKRKLIYTAITRAKKYLIMLGNLDAMKKGIQEIEIERKSRLKERIQEGFSNTQVVNEQQQWEEEIDDQISPYDFL